MHAGIIAAMAVQAMVSVAMLRTANVLKAQNQSSFPLSREWRTGLGDARPLHAPTGSNPVL
jgi:hypothetical protein